MGLKVCWVLGLKVLQGFKTETRELLGGAKENDIIAIEGVINLHSRHINDFFGRANRKKIAIVTRPTCNLSKCGLLALKHLPDGMCS